MNDSDLTTYEDQDFWQDNNSHENPYIILNSFFINPITGEKIITWENPELKDNGKA